MPLLVEQLGQEPITICLAKNNLTPSRTFDSLTRCFPPSVAVVT